MNLAPALAFSLAHWARSGLKIVDGAELLKRMEICSGCELFDPSGFGGTGKCLKCGCATQAKLRMVTESCPINKWESVSDIKNNP